MGQLRDRMKADLELKRYAPGTREHYLFCAEDFAKHYMRPPERLGEEEVRGFLLHLLHVRGVAASTLKMYVAGLKFPLRRDASDAEGRRACALAQGTVFAARHPEHRGGGAA